MASLASPLKCIELPEARFGDGFQNAKPEPRDISAAFLRHGYKAAADFQELLDNLCTVDMRIQGGL